MELPHRGGVEGTLSGELHPSSMEPMHGGILPVAVHDAWATATDEWVVKNPPGWGYQQDMAIQSEIHS